MGGERDHLGAPLACVEEGLRTGAGYGIAGADQAGVWRNITGTTKQALAEFARNHGALQILVRFAAMTPATGDFCATQQNPV